MSSGEESDNTVGIPEENIPSPSILYPGGVNPVLTTCISKPKLPTGNAQDPVKSSLSLSQIQHEQDAIDKVLISNLPPSTCSRLQHKIMDLEESLRNISLANQNERKEIAAIYSQSSQSLSQEDVTRTNDMLRQQLQLLAEKQRMLLTCFTKQKQIATKLRSVTTSTIKDTLDVLEPSSTNLQEKVTDKQNPDFAQPVPLDVLIQHKYIQPDINSLSCCLMGCVFKASLLSNGHLQGLNGKVFSLLQQWLSNCWSTLGHQKKVTRKQSYKIVLYKNVSLMTYCEAYNKRQVSTYLNQHKSRSTNISTSNPQSVSIPVTRTSFSINSLLLKGQVVKHQVPCSATSLSLPPSFWGRTSFDDLSVSTLQHLENELSW